MTEVAWAGWATITATVMGEAHRLQASPVNQDAVQAQPAEGGAVALAAADGHGAAAHFRSGEGAQMAVQAILKELTAMAEEPETIAFRTVARWREEVERHLALHPWSEEELLRIDLTLPDARLIPYGCTCLAAHASPAAVTLFQLGDGDVLTIDDGGNPFFPVAPEELPGEQTRSLCEPDADQYGRVAVLPVLRPPRLILVATDGLAKSFTSEEGFLQFGLDIAARLGEPGGAASVAERLPGWLAAISEGGSGDDVSAGLLFPVWTGRDV